ncbi:hypothetical protein LAV79_05275 [Peribacillus butanolivorans]|uniref:hypothetical protein n=1 Tax=Peribacillus butanolivorans TaxID=421767 RepID=UPI0030C96085
MEEEKKKPFAKKYQYGNTTVYVYSELLNMSKEDAQKWVQEQRAAGNPDLLTLDRLVTQIYLENYDKIMKNS